MKRICIIGGCGHVGIPLGLALASKSFDVTLLDVNEKIVNLINERKLPFKEDGAVELLNQHVGINLRATIKSDCLKNQDVIIFVTGTPVDEHHNPKIKEITNIIKYYLPYLNKNQLIILRSTIFPGTTEVIDNILIKNFGTSKLAFCPERIVQGQGIKEIFELPQIVSATSEIAYNEAKEVFEKISPKIIPLESKEAELAKLITNAWRYLEFAIANQFYMMVEDAGLDFYKILNAVKIDYPRAKNFSKAGLAAGPCLFKDTMQLSAFYKNQFFLGQSAMLVNEGLPNFLVKKLESKMGSLKNKKIAILGMTFKSNIDDIRESLAFKIKKELEFKMSEVLMSDVYLQETMDYKDAIEKADGIILGAPHDAYKNLKIDKPYVDCWSFWE